ncbi:MAG: TIR domain-containing protein [bacterium]|nr:TIR domain-containing protein [bacterium]
MSQDENKDTCRIFISRKTSDSNVVGEEIRGQLNLLAANRIEFFDAERIEEGQRWAEEIRKELDQADILLLVLTKPAKDDFDWCLYEAGLFEDLHSSTSKSIVCLYPEGEKVPDPLFERQGLEATTKRIFKYLVRLYTNPRASNTSGPLNAALADPKFAKAQLLPIAEKIHKLINRKPADKEQLIHANKYIQVILPAGVNSVGKDTQISSDRESLKELFDLPPSPKAGKLFEWSKLVAKARIERDSEGHNLAWANELETEIVAERGDDRTSRQLNSRYLARDGKLYRPEIEFFRKNENGMLTVDVTFSEQVQDSWLKNAEPPAALAANIALASRIRHELLEPFLKRLQDWRAKPENELPALERAKGEIERDGFFIRILSEGRMGEAFGTHPDEGQELARIGADFNLDVKPALEKAIVEKDLQAAIEALEAWRENNQRFLQIGLRVYRQQLDLDPPEIRPMAAAG